MRYSMAISITSVVLLSGGHYGSFIHKQCRGYLVYLCSEVWWCDDDSIDGMKEYDGDYVEQREDDLESAEDAMSDDGCWNWVDATDSCFCWEGQDAVGYGKKFFTYWMQMAKYSDKIIWGYRPNEECHYSLRNMELSSADKIKDNVFQHKNRYILIIQPTFSHDSDAKLTDKIEINAFISHLCLAGDESRRVVEYWWRWHKENSLTDESETLQDPNQMHSWLN